MKQKLLKSRLGAAFGSSDQKPPNPMNLPEEEKARLLLGTKLLVGFFFIVLCFFVFIF